MVYQLETAMGAAISVFDNATAIRVPRDRFAPVKKCQDLLALWSDAYVLTEEYQVVRNPKQSLGPPLLQLDSKYYKRIDQLKARFPHGAPSLLACRSLKVQGDVVFGKHIVIKGESAIANDSDRQVTIPDGSVIDTDMVFE
jgi:UTP--glucose-1-phosphate uridylyltransferase